MSGQVFIVQRRYRGITEFLAVDSLGRTYWTDDVDRAERYHSERTANAMGRDGGGKARELEATEA